MSDNQGITPPHLRNLGNLPTSNNTKEQIKSILGQIPNEIFEYLELSDEIRKEWKTGSKASDFGYHNQFVQKYTQQIEKLIQTAREEAELRGRIQEHNYVIDNYFPEYSALANKHDFKIDGDRILKELENRLQALSTQPSKDKK